MELCKDSGDAETPRDEELGNHKAHLVLNECVSQFDRLIIPLSSHEISTRMQMSSSALKGSLLIVFVSMCSICIVINL